MLLDWILTSMETWHRQIYIVVNIYNAEWVVMNKIEREPYIWNGYLKIILCKSAVLFCLIRKPIQLHFWQRGYLLDNLLLFYRRNDAILIVLPYNVTVRFMYKKLLPLHHIISHARLTWLNTQTMKSSILNLNTSNAYVTKRKRYFIDPQSYNPEN